MGVPGFRRPAVLLIAAAAATLLFMFSSGSKTTAVSFGPGYFAALSSTALGADADITTIFSLPAPDSLPGGGVFAFTPPDWELAGLPASSGGVGADLAIGDGSVVGSLTATVNLGIPALGADACFIPVSIPFTLVDANANPLSANTVAGSPNDPPLNVWPGFRAVPNSPTSLSLVPAAVPGWPDFLNPILAHLGGATPIARYYGQVNLVGEVIALNLLLFSPGAIPGFDAGLGYVAVPVLQDPFTPPPPDPLGAVCTNAAGPFAVTTIKGVTVGEPFLIPLPPCTLFSCPAPGIAGSMFHPSVPPNLPFGEVCNGVNDDGDATLDEGCNQVNRTNPSAPGTYLFELIAISDRDTDNDGIENPLDSCPLIVDATSTGAAAPFPGGFGWNPRFPGPQPQDADFDGLPGSLAFPSCDPNNNQTNLDEDSDLFSNLKDNCPSPLPVLAPIPGIPVIPIVSSNFSQAQAELGGPAPNDGGPISDGMGDPCDPNPTISDGHFHRAAAEGPVCLGLADGDGDGYCDADEIALGSNPGNPFSQPEDISGLAPGLLALGKVCSDGIDNDNDGLKDLADPGCQLPRHDIRFGPPPILFGPPNVTAPTVQQYTFFVRNFSFPPSTETVQVGVLVDPLTACPTAHVIGFSAAAGASLVSVGLGQDGQANFDSGGAPGPGGPLGSTATALEPEGFGLATLTLQPGPNPPGIVRVLIRFDNCGGFPNPGNDFLLTVDICHSGDPASLGLFSGFPPLGLSGAGCSGSNDGFQDRPPNNINDAPLSRMINDTTCC